MTIFNLTSAYHRFTMKFIFLELFLIIIMEVSAQTKSEQECDEIKSAMGFPTDPNPFLKLSKKRVTLNQICSFAMGDGHYVEATPLIFAIVDPKEESEIKKQISNLVAAKANINQADNNSLTPLMHSVRSEELIRFLIKSGANPKQKDKQGLTFLGHFSADQFKLREKMIATGYKPTLNDDLSFLVKLHKENAISLKAPQTLARLQDLVKKGGNQNLQIDGVSILAKAIRDADRELVNLLVSIGVNCTAGIEKSERRELFVAGLKLNSENPALAECFLRGTKENDWISQDGETMLMTALEIGVPPQVIDAFINAGAKVNAKDKAGQTPLMYAAFGGHQKQSQNESISKLIQAGADIHATDSNGYTVVMHAASVWSNDDKPRIERLEEAGARLDTKSSDNCSAVELAWLNNNAEMSKYLESKGNSLWPNNVLMCAVGSKRTEDHQFERALKQIKDGNAVDNQRRTALILAAQKCEYGWAKEIIRVGAQKYETDKEGKTALHYLKLCTQYRDRSTRTMNKIDLTELRSLLSY